MMCEPWFLWKYLAYIQIEHVAWKSSINQKKIPNTIQWSFANVMKDENKIKRVSQGIRSSQRRNSMKEAPP
jgi:hypothetical protein